MKVKKAFDETGSGFILNCNNLNSRIPLSTNRLVQNLVNQLMRGKQMWPTKTYAATASSISSLFVGIRSVRSLETLFSTCDSVLSLIIAPA